MAFSRDWETMFCSSTRLSAAAPRLGIDYVAASAATATIGGITLRQELNRLGVAGVVWNCARVLAEFLIDQHPKRLAGRRIVELGAGTGAVGLAVVLALSTSHSSCSSPQQLILSDLPEVVAELTQRNLEMAAATHPTLRTMVEQGQLAAVAHRWGATLDDHDKLLSPCDVVLCSDCLYEPQAYDALLATLRALSPQEVFIAYKQRHPEREQAFFQAASQFSTVSVWSDAATNTTAATPFLNDQIFVCRLQFMKTDDAQDNQSS